MSKKEPMARQELVDRIDQLEERNKRLEEQLSRKLRGHITVSGESDPSDGIIVREGARLELECEGTVHIELDWVVLENEDGELPWK